MPQDCEKLFHESGFHEILFHESGYNILPKPKECLNSLFQPVINERKRTRRERLISR